MLLFIPFGKTISMFQYSVGSTDSALCMPPPSSDESQSEQEPGSRSMSPESEVTEPCHVIKGHHEDVFTSESENSSVATCRTVRRVDPTTGELTTISPTASQSFGSNLSLTVSETESSREKQQSTNVVGNGKAAGPVSYGIKLKVYPGI